MKSILSLFLMLFFVSVPVRADDGQGGYCQRAETTADLMDCIGHHYKEAENHMMNALTSLENQGYMDETWGKNQAEWIAFRDATCALQAKAYEGGSLSRVEELDCRARMTAERARNLDRVVSSYDHAYTPEFTNPPRWVNVLVRDYPDMFWAFGTAQEIDTDCDGVTENLIRGIKNDNMVIAIADSQKTGRPKATIIHFDDSQNCHLLPEISLETLPEPKPDPDQDKPLRCLQKIKIKTKSCGDLTVEYNTTKQTYQIAP